MTILHDLVAQGQAVWLDYIRRSFITSGELAALVAKGARGVTSNPSIFEKAIAGSADYDEEIAALVAEGRGVEEIYEALACKDIRLAAAALAPVFEATGGEDGYVSLEVSPRLADDTEGTVAEARRLFKELGCPNVMIKVPATPEGVPAVEALIAEGINVNATLIFSIAQYEAVALAYLAGLERLAASGGDVRRVASVASFFVSRLDSAVDKELATRGEAGLKGFAAVDNARLAYARFKELFAGPRWERLAASGARVQRPLWASTGTKDPAYPDTLYVDTLVGPHTVNTIPPATLDAFLDHGAAAFTVENDLPGARERLARYTALGIDLDAIIAKLLADGVASFSQAFDALLDSVAQKRRRLLAGRKAVVELLGASAGAVEAGVSALESARVMERLWAHDHTLWSDSPEEIANRLGWLDILAPMRAAVRRMNRLRETLMSEGTTHALLLGMGGSSLAPEVFATAFPDAGGLKLSVVDTTVPGAILAAERAHDPAKTVYIVSTKSGGTVETLSLFKYFHARAVERLGRDAAGRRFVAITDPGSALERWASELGFRDIWINDPNIGGRYAALSLVGLVPAALVGVDVAKLLDRADDAAANAKAAKRVSGEPDHAARLGAFLGALNGRGRDKLTLVCSRRIGVFGDWVEQLVAESTGKNGKGILPVVGEPLGAPEVYGNDRLFAAILLDGDREFDAALDALAAAGHPVVKMYLTDRYDLGEQFFLWTVATAVASWFLKVQPFNQPDVESAKVAGRAMLERFNQTGALEGAAPATVDGDIAIYGDVAGGSAAEVLEKFLAGAGPGDYVALQAYTVHDSATDAALEALRLGIRSRTRCAVTVGYGPRFLHSTGQLHKGDAGRGRFVQFTADDLEDMPIPDTFGATTGTMPFGILKQSQALGDAEALRKAGRKVLRFHSRADAAGAIARIAKG